MSKLYFFRHAQASFMADDYDQLSLHGERQSAELGDYLIKKKMYFDRVFVGPLQRQKHTFEIVADVFSKRKLSIPKPVYLDDLKEHSGTEAMFAIYPNLLKTIPQIQHWHLEGEAKPAKRKRNRLLVFQYFMDEWAQGNIEVPGVEPWDIFRKKVKKGLNAVLDQTGKGEVVGIFTSGGTISSIIAEALNIQDEQRVSALNFSIRNTSITSFLYSRNKFNLLSFNELPHLDGEMETFV